jgi:hypothetical protein
MFFSEEKSQKTLNSCTGVTMRHQDGIAKPAEKFKVFCFFFSKKKCFLIPAWFAIHLLQNRSRPYMDVPLAIINIQASAIGRHHTELHRDADIVRFRVSELGLRLVQNRARDLPPEGIEAVDSSCMVIDVLGCQFRHRSVLPGLALAPGHCGRWCSSALRIRSFPKAAAGEATKGRAAASRQIKARQNLLMPA